MKPNKVFAFLMLLAMMVSILAGCNGATTTEAPAAEAPVAEAPAAEAPAAEVVADEAPAVADLPSVVNVAIGADPADLAPFVGMSMGRIAVLRTMYEYLVENKGSEWAPFIANEVVEIDPKTADVTIFDYVTDSAGNKITAKDVAWSFNTGMAAGNLRPLGDIESVTVTGEYTVRFVFKKELGMGDLYSILSEAPVVSQAAFEASADQFATKPITTSPYVLTEYVPGSSLTFEKRADYWQTDPALMPELSQANVQKIVMQIITEPAQHAIALETGTVDISASVTSADISLFQDKPGFTVFKFLDNLTQVLSFNGSDGNPFTKMELRQAVAYAIDTAAMCEAVAPGACASAHGIGNTNFFGYPEKWNSEPYYEFDLAKAQELFAASGYKAGDLTVKLLAQNDPNSGLIAQVIQSQLKELGITVEINQVESSVYNQLKYDPTAFDLLIDAAAGGDFVFSPWKLLFDAQRYNGTTSNFFADDQLQTLLATASAQSTYSPETLDAFQSYQKEQVYAYGLLSYQNLAAGVEGITFVARDGRGQLIPGAFVYSADFKK